MHLTGAVVILEYAQPKEFHDVIVNEFNVKFKGGLVLPPHAISQLEPRFLFEFIEAFLPTDQDLVSISNIYVIAITEVFHAYILSQLRDSGLQKHKLECPRHIVN